MTDNNGELGRSEKDNEMKKTKKAENMRLEKIEIVGKHTRRRNVERGNGNELLNMAKAYEMVEMTTRVKCEECKNCKTKNKKRCENTKTWTHPNGKIERQIDYVLIGKNTKTGSEKSTKQKMQAIQAYISTK